MKTNGTIKRRPFLFASLIVFTLFTLFCGVAYFLAGEPNGSPALVGFGDKVGVIEIQGPIIFSEDIVSNIVKFRKDSSIKAVVVRVDSPGGSVGPSQEIYQEIKRTTKEKPVVVSMGSVAASGGYYVAAPATMIFANPGTLTGSIGVIMEFANLEELLQKIGVSSKVIKSGKFKDIGSPQREMNADEQILLHEVVSDVHQQFVEAITSGRSLSEQDVLSFADGRIFSGRQAKKLGLVDHLGGLQDAIAKAAELGGIMGDPSIVYPVHKKHDYFKYFLDEAASYISGVKQQFAAPQPGLNFLWRGP